ncbi:MAG: DNA-binding response regulator, partial [Clostridiales bacterium]|nr:DNA-binding response regulator [Clostridiales bacterium]
MLNGIKVLIIDDDPHIAELVSLYLIKEGFETKEVYSGKKGLEA